ncbi:hypothetical protein QEZ47_15530 [Aminobacter anthyllidis]|uniref:hypothetical protein n=1 Tax=Aminobacter anthyllidis TaxID=1035067 RepID=UPI0024590884|nr:hypothetical protein [Aminobacter anthyllidis]MDH4986916.1 hypothetical protein [Aminobacter anthyllidis]
MTPDFDFSRIRAEGGDRREGFEEFSAQIFHRYTVTAGSRYERYRGSGGDGGVEAIWRLPTGKIVGLQSKFFLPLKAAHLGQLEKSLDTALDNFPNLETYIVTLPFDPTPSVKARKGEGQAEKLETWRLSLIDRAAKRGASIQIAWWFASELKSRLLGMDNPAGRILYWFGTPILSTSSLEAAAVVAEGVAGARYSPKLRVGTSAGDILKAFGLDPSWPAVGDGWGARLREAVRIWTSHPPSAHPIPSGQILSALTEAEARFAAVEALTFSETDRVTLHSLGVQTLPIAQALEGTLKTEFDSKYGAQSDTPGWRQFQAAYQVAFPAADLDRARSTCTLLSAIIAFADSSAARAAGSSILLMRGPAGIGKTHTTIDATKERLVTGRAAMAILGQEITGQDLWEVVARKLEISPTASKAEVIGVLAVYAEKTAAPFVVMVDAINETPDRKQWRSWLPQLTVDLEGQPIKLLLTCRDIFVDGTLGTAGAGLVSFTHEGFAGREYDAAYAFATFYKVGPPAEVVAQPEFANPLFLHLVCRAAVSRKWSRIPGGQVGLTNLITAILEGANEEAAKLLDHDIRLENPVREGAMALAKVMGQTGVRHLKLNRAHSILTGVRASSGASTSLLRAMEEADLISVSVENDDHIMRFAFERLGDLLIARASVEGQSKTVVEARFLSGDLAALVATAETVAENAGVLQAYSILLPELFGIEIADLLHNAPTNREVTVLALGVLVWRDLASFTDTAWVLRHQRFIDLMDVFDQVLAVAAVPGHPLNAKWLDAQLRGYAQIGRDALWTSILKRSWSEAGPGHQLVQIAREQNLSHMSRASAELLGFALAWFTGSADLLIRDEASQALTRLVNTQPIVVPLLDAFIACDDDFIRERVLNAAYGAGLLRKDATYWGEIADITFQCFFAAGAPPESVLLRDLGRLIVEEAHAAGTMPGGASLAAARPPYSSNWPLNFNFPDWPALEAVHPDLPGNLKLGKNMQPDFAIYCVKPRTSAFDLAASGITTAQLNQWIVEQILNLGYDGRSKIALEYDHNLVYEHGDGRGVPSRHRRISKKYEWIFLGRLLGRLRDHVPHRTSSWEAAPSPTSLQGLELRTLDPTDLSEGELSPIPGLKVADFFTTPVSKAEIQDPKDWTAALFTSDETQLVGDNWVMLAGSQSWRHEDKRLDVRLVKPRHVSTMLVPDRDMIELRKSFGASVPNRDIPELHRLFDGEYPTSVAFRINSNEWSLGSEQFGSPASTIIRGFDAPETPRHDLWAPSPELIAFTATTWDGARSWVDVSGNLIATQIGSDDNVALVFDKARLAEYLNTMKATLVWILFENRHASTGSEPLGSADRYQAWSWKGKKLAKIGEEKDFYSSDEEGSSSNQQNDDETA